MVWGTITSGWHPTFGWNWMKWFFVVSVSVRQCFALLMFTRYSSRMKYPPYDHRIGSSSHLMQAWQKHYYHLGTVTLRQLTAPIVKLAIQLVLKKKIIEASLLQPSLTASLISALRKSNTTESTWCLALCVSVGWPPESKFYGAPP